MSTDYQTESAVKIKVELALQDFNISVVNQSEPRGLHPNDEGDDV
jgi:hypothetical protein